MIFPEDPTFGYSKERGSADTLPVPLTVAVRVPTLKKDACPWKWAYLKARAHNLREAKLLAEKYYQTEANLIFVANIK